MECEIVIMGTSSLPNPRQTLSNIYVSKIILIPKNFYLVPSDGN